MDRAEQEQWREKVRLCAVAIGLFPVSPAAYMGWNVKEHAEGSFEFPYMPMTNGGQSQDLIVRFGLCIQCQARSRRVGNTTRSYPYMRWRVRRHSGLYFSEWREDLNKSVVDYIADQGGKIKYWRGVRKSTPTR